MNRTAWISLLAAALLVGPGRALGEETLEYEMAKTHYDLGAKYYQQGNYEIALDEFRKAYKLEPRPALRFNIGRCQEAMGQGEEAIASYEAFLKAVPGTPERRAVELRIQNIRQRLKEREGDKQPAGEEGAAGHPPPGGADADVANTPSPDLSSEGGADAGPRPLKIAGWTGVGVGAAALVTAAVMGGLALGKIGAYEDAHNVQHTSYEEARDLLSAADRYETTAYALLGVGLAAAAAGAVALIWDWQQARGRQHEAPSPEAALAVQVTPAGVAVTF